MKRRFIALFPSEFRHNPAHFQALGLACVYIIMAVLQLFTFERFTDVTAGYGFPGGRAVAIVIALLLPISTIAALPYLLSMKLSKRVCRVSRMSVLVAAGLWVVIGLWTNLSGNTVGSLGVFGATLDTPNEWWSLVFIAFLAWASWLIYAARVSRHEAHTSSHH